LTTDFPIRCIPNITCPVGCTECNSANISSLLPPNPNTSSTTNTSASGTPTTPAAGTPTTPAAGTPPTTTNSVIQCSVCDSANGYYLENGFCIKSCDAAKFFNPVAKECQACPVNCIKCKFNILGTATDPSKPIALCFAVSSSDYTIKEGIVVKVELKCGAN
jgi:hypothetical protein